VPGAYIVELADDHVGTSTLCAMHH
jgi:hypothetical protein